MALYSSYMNHRFGVKYHLRVQGRKYPIKKPACRRCLATWNPEDLTLKEDIKEEFLEYGKYYHSITIKYNLVALIEICNENRLRSLLEQLFFYAE
jgi:hypothetical protein